MAETGHTATRRVEDQLDCAGTAPSFLSLGEKLRSASEDHEVAEELLRAIEGEILPRLMLAHGVDEDSASHGAETSAYLTRDLIEEMAQRLIGASASSAEDVVHGLLARNIATETILVDLLAPAARRLGELWEEDRCSFADVTIGLCRLHELLRRSSVVGDAAFRAPAGPRRSILLATVCGDQHVFGLMIVAEFFRRDGWRVWSEPGAPVDELGAILSETSIDLIGLSLARDVDPRAVGAEIAELKSASANRDVQVIVGGARFAQGGITAEDIGANGVLTDAVAAPATARRILSSARVGC